MPSIQPVIQPFAAIYIGDYSASAVLTRIDDLRTNGAVVEDSLPTSFVSSLGRRVQSGNHLVTVTLIFYPDSELVTRIKKGISVSGDETGDFAFGQYSLFLRSPDDTDTHSYYLPRVDTDRVYRVNYQKDTATTVAVDFIAEARSVSDNIIYKDTVSSLDSTMGSKSPV